MNGIEGWCEGQVYLQKISVEDASKFAKVFGEGSTMLTKLIEFCIINNIKTIASCKGHPETKNFFFKNTGYISFSIDELDYQENGFAYYLAEIPKKIKGVTVELTNNSVMGPNITLRVPAHKNGMSELYFQEILIYLQKYLNFIQENNYVEENEDIKKVVNYMFSTHSDEIICITNKYFEKLTKKDNYYQLTNKCPMYKQTNIFHKIFSNSIPKKLNKFLEVKKR